MKLNAYGVISGSFNDVLLIIVVELFKVVYLYNVGFFFLFQTFHLPDLFNHWYMRREEIHHCDTTCYRWLWNIKIVSKPVNTSIVNEAHQQTHTKNVSTTFKLTSYINRASLSIEETLLTWSVFYHIAFESFSMWLKYIKHPFIT